MKKIILAGALIIALASCSKDECKIDTTSDGVLQTISVKVEQFGGQTKTAVSPTGAFTWSAGDQIGIYPVNTTIGLGQTSQQVVFRINSSGDASSATFTGTGWGLVTGGTYKYFSYYPYSASAAYNEAVVSYSNNLNQSENENTDHLGCNDYLYAPQIQPDNLASASFTFKHLSALVEFEITVPDSLNAKKFTRMEVIAPTSLFTTAGTYNPSSATTSDAVPSITSTGSTNKLTLTLNGSTGFTPDVNNKLHLYFLIAPAAVKDKQLDIKLWDTDNVAYISSKTPSSNITSQDYRTYECDLTPKPTENLSAGETANCYIVPEGGRYKFLANIKGNGVCPSNISESSALDMEDCTAAVIWETFNTGTTPSVGDIVRDVNIDGDYITFRATGTQGNALIALKNSSDKILWSWHIWCTNADLDSKKQYYGGAYMMDRNLGALSATSGDALAMGFHYQWGRPCPIIGGWSYTESTSRMATTNSTEWEGVEASSTTGTLDYSAAHPTHFIKYSESNVLKGTSTVSKNWLWTAADYTTGESMPALWGEDKTMYDPCPKGWKIPVGTIWKTAGFSTKTCVYTAAAHGRNYTSISPAAYYPLPGWISTYTNEMPDNFGTHAICWSYEVDTDDTVLIKYFVYSNGGLIDYYSAAGRYFGCSVRPCQD